MIEPAKKVPSSAAQIFWCLFRCVVMAKKMGVVGHDEMNEKGRDEIFDHILYLLINYAGLAV